MNKDQKELLFYFFLTSGILLGTFAYIEVLGILRNINEIYAAIYFILTIILILIFAYNYLGDKE